MSKKEEQKNIDVYLQQGERQENTWHRRQHTKKKKKTKVWQRRHIDTRNVKVSTQIHRMRDRLKQREEVTRQN